MIPIIKPLRAALLGALLLPAVVPASPLFDAMSAHENGDYARAHELLLPLAHAGSVEAQYRMATLYSLGQGRPIDHAVAAGWFELAAAQDHHQAAVTLANMHLAGLGVQRDEKAAIRWFERAAAIAEKLALDVEECD